MHVVQKPFRFVFRHSEDIKYWDISLTTALNCVGIPCCNALKKKCIMYFTENEIYGKIWERNYE